MIPHFTRVFILACAWMILGSAIPSSSHKVAAAKQTFYYWYWTDTDSYMQWASTATEINDLEAMTGKLVNTQPGGGTLLANGYTNNNYPHTVWPSVQLYSH